MASITNKHGNRNVQFTIGEKRPVIYLGRISASDARTIGNHIDKMVVAKINRSALPPETAEFIDAISDKFHEKFSRQGLVPPRAFADNIKKTITYFIQRMDGGPIKIGITSRGIRTKLATMQPYCHVPFVCIGFINGNCEDFLHDKFHGLCISGEWFEALPTLLEFISIRATPCRESLGVPTPEQPRWIREGW